MNGEHFAQSMLEYLAIVSNANVPLNLLVHVVVFGSFIALYLLKNLGIKTKVVQGNIFLLFLSVTINAYIHGNPVHMGTFALLALVALMSLLRGKNEVHPPKYNLNTLISVGIIIMGIWYPKFVEAGWLESLFVSPLGAVPCPTLLTSLGLLTLFYPHVDRFQYTVTTLIGLFYAIIGVFIFKVYIDITLLLIVIYSFYNLFYLYRPYRITRSQPVRKEALK